MRAGYKEGYLTKRGKNFGGWKARYFVLQGPILGYYESQQRGGAHLGSIVITNAQIGRQQRSNDSDDEKNYRHALLIIEAKKGPGGDVERDSWVDILVRYVTGTYNEESLPTSSSGPSPISVNVPHSQSLGSGQPRPSTSSNQDGIMAPNGKRAMRSMLKDEISRGPVVSISQLPPDASNAKFFAAAPLPCSASFDDSHWNPAKSVHTSIAERDQFTAEENARWLLERAGSTEPPLSSSLPTSSPLDAAARRPVSGSPTGTTFPERAPSPDVGSTPLRGGDPNGKVKISGPLSGAPIPAGYKFGGKDAPPEGTSSSDRREKAKSRSFWNFGGPTDKPVASAPRAVFGVSLDEPLDVAEIARLPAVVFRCIQYLEAKKAEQEEDFVEPQERIRELSYLIAPLPTANYSLLRALTAHLILIVQNSPVNKMTMRNVGIVFSPTLGIPAGVFSSMLGEFNRVFNVDADQDVPEDDEAEEKEGQPSRRNSRQYSDAAADQLLVCWADFCMSLTTSSSLSSLAAPTEETPFEDGDSISIPYGSGDETTENDAAVESCLTRSSNPSQQSGELLSPTRSDSPPSENKSHASNIAASRGLNITVTKKSNRHSWMMGLPLSPWPPANFPHSPPSSMHTTKQS
ncbi:hypothetical protein HYDPIDRAFT_167327 [Hydnomerulius pinastri MD-312]|nr:hypothetical protein HYDPIDRAFT_167327 [Hydnomerulius pinastri MD-312]